MAKNVWDDDDKKAAKPGKNVWDDDDKKAAKAGKDDTKTEQEKVPEGELPSQLQPYPTGNPPPPRDYLGRPVNEQGQPLDAQGNVVKEPTPPKEEKK